VDPVPEPLFLRNPGSLMNRTQDPGLSAKNSDHKTTEADKYVNYDFPENEFYIEECRLLGCYTVWLL
jgi:hypothetical protein